MELSARKCPKGSTEHGPPIKVLGNRHCEAKGAHRFIRWIVEGQRVVVKITEERPSLNNTRDDATVGIVDRHGACRVIAEWRAYPLVLKSRVAKHTLRCFQVEGPNPGGVAIVLQQTPGVPAASVAYPKAFMPAAPVLRTGSSEVAERRSVGRDDIELPGRRHAFGQELGHRRPTAGRDRLNETEFQSVAALDRAAEPDVPS